MRRKLLAIGLIALAASGCRGVSQLDLSRIGSRASWQLPERVIASLEIAPGDRVADLGAGGGYFLPYLVTAVGPAGTVYAVDVEPEIVRELEQQAADAGYTNVVAVLGGADDPGLPDGAIDLVVLVNTYHHIDARPAYFERLRRNLKPSGRVAVIDPNAETKGVLRLFLDAEHMSFAPDVRDEIRSAGYHPDRSFAFLPTQIFEVFAADSSPD
jgi:ubiquinone/menaquinone biosynthesis C-methylase UbiE